MESLRTPIQIRIAVPADVPALHALIEASVRGLMPQGYTSDQLEGALGTLLGVDTQLIADGTYFVAEAVLNDNSMLVGCGGWSKRKTLFGSDHRRGREDELLDPHKDAAKIRAFFVHPQWARRLPGFRCIKPEATSRSSALKCRLRTARRFLSCAWPRQLAEADGIPFYPITEASRFVTSSLAWGVVTRSRPAAFD